MFHQITNISSTLADYTVLVLYNQPVMSSLLKHTPRDMLQK